MLKLFALRDQANEAEKGYGRHHAFDIYAIVRMLTRREWDDCRELRERYSGHPMMEEGWAELGNGGDWRPQPSIATSAPGGTAGI